jgi:hypothetical protein
VSRRRGSYRCRRRQMCSCERVVGPPGGEPVCASPHALKGVRSLGSEGLAARCRKMPSFHTRSTFTINCPLARRRPWLPRLRHAPAFLAQQVPVVGERRLKRELLARVGPVVVDLRAQTRQRAQRLGMTVIGPPLVF